MNDDDFNVTYPCYDMFGTLIETHDVVVIAGHQRLRVGQYVGLTRSKADPRQYNMTFVLEPREGETSQRYSIPGFSSKLLNLSRGKFASTPPQNKIE